MSAAALAPSALRWPFPEMARSLPDQSSLSIPIPGPENTPQGSRSGRSERNGATSQWLSIGRAWLPHSFHTPRHPIDGVSADCKNAFRHRNWLADWKMGYDTDPLDFCGGP